jgi:ABC-2 type transport system permease protein
VTRPSDLALAWLWLKGRLRLMTRTPRATFFTFIFPLILPVLLNSLGGGDVSVPGGKVPYSQYITPAIAIFALTAATYSFVIFGVATAREQGTFKRVRGTPLPMWVFLGSWVASPCWPRSDPSRSCSSLPCPSSASTSVTSSCPPLSSRSSSGG